MNIGPYYTIVIYQRTGIDNAIAPDSGVGLNNSSCHYLHPLTQLYTRTNQG